MKGGNPQNHVLRRGLPTAFLAPLPERDSLSIPAAKPVGSATHAAVSDRSSPGRTCSGEVWGAETWTGAGNICGGYLQVNNL